MEHYASRSSSFDAPIRLKSSSGPEGSIRALFRQAGIEFDGGQPFDIQIRHPRVFDAIAHSGSLGFGESYMAGDWECAQLDEMACRLLAARLDQQPIGVAQIKLLAHRLRSRLINLQSPTRAYQVGEQHYDIGNDVFERMLDPLMIYSCGYWERALDLAQAQQDKCEMICRKLQLLPGERLLDIGCGWGGLAAYAASHFGVQVHGVTVSKQQAELARERCKGLPVTIGLRDYRLLTGHYDKIVSVGMFEHVGQKNYRTFFDMVQRLLKPEGIFLLHTIGTEVTSGATDPWIDHYIFPNGRIPDAREIVSAMQGRLLLEDWHNFGPDYDRTLMAWATNFSARWPEISGRYGEQFFRMWRYYLLGCAGYFRARQGQLWQLVLTRADRKNSYRSFRFSPAQIRVGGRSDQPAPAP
ncbi:MAG: cyclopropane fatty acyl phospholipid synthase [Betaproteobacteria bacterium]|nr:cyclopropane fatty acyl phospholipid synthase [Betaproteobacteria bacterium]